jgi:hypothetical protein
MHNPEHRRIGSQSSFEVMNERGRLAMRGQDNQVVGWDRRVVRGDRRVERRGDQVGLREYDPGPDLFISRNDDELLPPSYSQVINSYATQGR